MFKIRKYQSAFIIVLLVSLTGCACTTKVKTDPLPSWNEGASKTNIIEFVQTVTDQSSPDYVLPAERIATFDAGSRYFCESLFWASQPKQAAKT